MGAAVDRMSRFVRGGCWTVDPPGRCGESCTQHACKRSALRNRVKGTESVDLCMGAGGGRFAEHGAVASLVKGVRRSDS